MIAPLMFVLVQAVDPGVAQGEDGERARMFFGKYKFSEASDVAHRILLEQPPTGPAALEELRRIAAFSDFYLNRLAAAKEMLGSVFRTNPEATIDRTRYPPQLVAFFEDVRAEILVRQKAAPSGLQMEVEAKPASSPVSAPEGPRSAPRRKFSPLSLLPFGIGQLALGDHAAGVIWLTLTAGLFAANLTLYLMLMKDRRADGLFADPPAARALQIAENVSGGALIAVVLAGLLDSLIWSPQRMHQRALSVSLVPGRDSFVLAIGGGL